MSSKKVELFIFKVPQRFNLHPDEVLSGAQKKTYKKITHEKRQREFLSSRLVMKKVIEDLYGENLNHIKKTKNGKPYLQNLKFNLSHSQNFIILAVSREFELGVDIESSKRVRPFKEISGRYFSKKENVFILSKTAAQFARFKTLWSLKEAFIKSIDGVLNKKTSQIFFDVEKKKIDNLPAEKKVSLFLNRKLHLALCVLGKINRSELGVFELKFEQGSELIRCDSNLKMIQIRA